MEFLNLCRGQPKPGIRSSERYRRTKARTLGPSYSLGGRDFFFFRALCGTTPFLLVSSQLFLQFLCLISFLLSKCWGKHSCMNFTFPIAILNGTISSLMVLSTIPIPTVKLQVHNVHSEGKSRNTQALVNYASKLSLTDVCN